MNLDVEGSGQHEAVGVRFPCTPGHDGGNQDEGLQRPACPVAATVLLGGVFDLFPDLRSDKLTHRTGERLGTLGDGVVPVSLMPAPREPNTVQPWDRPCLHWGLAWNHAMMTKDGLIFEANSLKQGRLQALTRQQLQAQATQNRERR